MLIVEEICIHLFSFVKKAPKIYLLNLILSVKKYFDLFYFYNKQI